MDKHDKKKIKEHLPTLVENIDPVQIMTYLPCLLEYHRECIGNAHHSIQGSRTLAVHKLLDILYTRPTGFRELVEALRNPEVDKDDIADRLDPPDASTHSNVHRRITRSEIPESPQRTTTTTVTARQSRKSSKKLVTMETPYKLLPVSVHNKLKVLDSCQIKNVDKLAEVIELTLQDVHTIKARCKDSLTLDYLQYWDEREDSAATLLDLFQVLHKMDRIDLIQKLEKSLNVSFEPEVEDVGDEQGASNNAEGASRSEGHVVSDTGHHNVQPHNIGPAPQQPTVGEGFNPANNRTPIRPDVRIPDTYQQRPTNVGRALDITRPETNLGNLEYQGHQIPSYLNMQPEHVLRNANGCGDGTTEYMNDPRSSDSMFKSLRPSSGNYSDKTYQDGNVSLESDMKEHPISEKQFKFTGYAPAEILNSNQYHSDGFVQECKEEKGDSIKDDPEKIFKRYKEEEILFGDGAYGNEMRASQPPSTMISNQSSSPKPLEQIYSKINDFSEKSRSDLTANPRPELGHQIGDDVRNIEASQDDSSTSSISDNSLYGSITDTIEKLNLTGDKKVENVGIVWECEIGDKLRNESIEKDNFAADKSHNAKSSMEGAQNVPDSSVRFDSIKSSGLSENFEVGNTEQQRSRLEQAMLHGNFDNIHEHVMGSADSASRTISIADSMTSYSYVSQNDDIEMPKLSLDSELNSMMKKANKRLPGDDQGEDDLSSYDNDLNEQLSIDGMSPGVIDGVIPTGNSKSFTGVQVTSPGTQETSPKAQGTSYWTQGTNPGAQGISPRENGSTGIPRAQATSPRTQGTQPFQNEPCVIQQPPKLANSDLPHGENVCVVNNNFQGVPQDRSQYGQYSVHEPPRLLDMGATPGHDTVHGDNVVTMVAKQQTGMVTTPVSEEAKSDDTGNSADNGRWNNVLTSSLRVAFNVFKSTNDSLL